jgi:hypothetical protein
MGFPIALSRTKFAAFMGNREVAGRSLARQVIGGKNIEILCEFIEMIPVVVSKPPARLAIFRDEPSILRGTFFAENLIRIELSILQYVFGLRVEENIISDTSEVL